MLILGRKNQDTYSSNERLPKIFPGLTTPDNSDSYAVPELNLSQIKEAYLTSIL